MSDSELDDEYATVLLSLASAEKLEIYPTIGESGNSEWEKKLRNNRRVKVTKEKYLYTMARYIRLMKDKAEEVRKVFEERELHLDNKELRQYLDEYEKMLIVNAILSMSDN